MGQSESDKPEYIVEFSRSRSGAKKSTACKITHLPTGVSASADTRKRRISHYRAMTELRRRLADSAKSRARMLFAARSLQERQR